MGDYAEEGGSGASPRDASAPRDVFPIVYDPSLVGRLREEHQELARILAAITCAVAECRLYQLPKLLFVLDVAFRGHTIQENAEFYAYVQQRCAADPAAARLIYDARREIDGIAGMMARFVHTHTATLPTPETVAKFNAELDQVGSVLLWHMRLEEGRLYSLYRPAH